MNECLCTSQYCIVAKYRDDAGSMNQKKYIHLGDIVTINARYNNIPIQGRVDMIGGDEIRIDASKRYYENIVTVQLYDIENISVVEDK